MLTPCWKLNKSTRSSCFQHPSEHSHVEFDFSIFLRLLPGVQPRRLESPFPLQESASVALLLGRLPFGCERCTVACRQRQFELGRLAMPIVGQPGAQDQGLDASSLKNFLARGVVLHTFVEPLPKVHRLLLHWQCSVLRWTLLAGVNCLSLTSCPCLASRKCVR